MAVTKINFKNLSTVAEKKPATISSQKNYPNKPIPTGAYKAIVKNVKEERSKASGAVMWHFTLKLIDGQVTGWKRPELLNKNDEPVLDKDGKVKYPEKELDYKNQELLYETYVVVDYENPAYSVKAQSGLATKLSSTLKALNINSDIDIVSKIGTPVAVSIRLKKYEKTSDESIQYKGEVEEIFPISELTSIKTIGANTAQIVTDDSDKDVPF